MTSPTLSNRPVHRSAIETSHAALGARWVDAASRWPADYGDPARETEAVRRSAGLAEVGGLAISVVRGHGSSAVLRSAGLELRVGEVMARDGMVVPVQAWGIAPDEALVLRPVSPGEPDLRLVDLRPAGHAVSVVDVTAGLTSLRLAGPHALRILAELCAIDLDPQVFLNHRIAQAPVANVRVTLARLDRADTASYEILVARDYAEYLWDAILHSGKAHGLTPVGPAAIENGARQ